jgi:hypothetical protein
MKSRKIRWQGLTTQRVWCAFRDTGILTIMIFACGAVKTLLKDNRIIEITANGIRITAIVFAIVFAANSLACAFGVTTITDNLGGPERGYGVRVPGTMIVTAVVGLISFVIFLLMGLVT